MQRPSRPAGCGIRVAGALLAAALTMPSAWPAMAAGTPEADMAQACVKPTESTADEIAACLERVQIAADTRLNRTYQAALASLGEPDRAALREAQRAWVTFREKDRASLSGGWRARRALGVRIDAAQADIAAINARELELRIYLP